MNREGFAALAQTHAQWALGVLGWSPQAFWAATPLDLRLAWIGWSAFHGVASVPCTRDVTCDLMQRFPD